MESEIDENLVLDYVVFQILPTQNSYEALICTQDKIEKLVDGPFDQLALHFPESSSLQDNSFKLQLSDSLKGSSWFTKSTLLRFLNIVNTPGMLKVANAIQNEMSQLEETRRFQLALFAKGHLDNYGAGKPACSIEVGLAQKIKVETASSDATKNQLLRAMDLRLVTLKEELDDAFSQAAGVMCSVRQLSDLVAFMQHFGAKDLRNLLSNYLVLVSMEQPDPGNHIKINEEEIHPVPHADAVKPTKKGMPAAKIAQAEHQSSTESEKSSESSDEDKPFAERSRLLVRSASPRRSASPMRRIQIGRSGSRRSTPITIKSLNYFPARDKTSSSRDADGTNLGDERSNHLLKRPESTVRRMSVQDAINLFESKQKEQVLDIQKQKASAEVPVTTKKSVLRRWSSGMGDSFTHYSHENSSDADSENISSTLPLYAEKKWTEVRSEIEPASGSQVENDQVNDSSETERIPSPQIDSPDESLIPRAEEINNRTTASDEWSRQKEAELNQMLMKMTESKPGKYQNDAVRDGHLDTSGSQVENAQVNDSSEIERIRSPQIDSPDELVIQRVEEINDRTTATDEWSRQKEAELNQMLIKMTEREPVKYQNDAVRDGHLDTFSEKRKGSPHEKRGGCYSQYKEKRDEKLRAENVRMRVVKETQFRVMQETPEHKAVMASKTVGSTVKQNSLNPSQRPRRNSSPPVLTKKEASKPASSKKVSAKLSPIPGTRSSWSSGSFTKASGTPPPKPSTGTVTSNSSPNRRKPNPLPFSTKPISRTEKPLQQPKGRKTTLSDVKPSLKGQEEKQKSVSKTSRSVKTKSLSVPRDDFGANTAKPSFYNKVTKKSSVVPLESKPFLRKGTRTSPGVGPVLAKPKVCQLDESSKNSENLVPAEVMDYTGALDESSKNSENLVPAEEMDYTGAMVEATSVLSEYDLTQTEADVDVNSEIPFSVTNALDQEMTENLNHELSEDDNDHKNPQNRDAEIQHDEDMAISSAAWVEAEHHEVSVSCENGLQETVASPELAPEVSSSPHIRHSLSQMLQADSCESDIIGWGNAENPPALIYQKDAPKGFKRLLKFARKNKGDTNATGWASPSVFSEGEDDPEESKAANKRSDSLLRKSGTQVKAYGHQKNMFSESFNRDSKREMDYCGIHDTLSAQSTKKVSTVNSEKLRQEHNPTTVTSTKGVASQARQSFDTVQHSSKSWWRR